MNLDSDYINQTIREYDFIANKFNLFMDFYSC